MKSLKLIIDSIVRKRSNINKQNVQKNSNINLTDQINLLIKHRLKKNLSRKELSSKTRISVNVLEALENGWINKLPERTFLYSMLKTIENELNLPSGSLNNFLSFPSNNKLNRSNSIFTAEKINLFNSWQGNLSYVLLILLSIFILNKYQRYLATLNTITVEPLKIESINNPEKNKSIIESTKP